jgi:hypothetical protein
MLSKKTQDQNEEGIGGSKQSENALLKVGYIQENDNYPCDKAETMPQIPSINA